MKIILTLTLIILSLPQMLGAQTIPNNTVDLLWEGETYTPRHYPGRPLPSAGSLVRVVAMPSHINTGAVLNSAQLTFKWVKDQNPIQSASGQGKNILEYAADKNGVSSVVSVEVRDQQSEILARAQTTITPVSPKLVLYPIKPLVNPAREIALTGATAINSSETTLMAEPFFFPTLDLTNNQVSFDWRVDGVSVGVQRENPRLFTVAATNQSEGEVSLMVSAKNESNPLQVVSQVITLGLGAREFNF